MDLVYLAFHGHYVLLKHVKIYLNLIYLKGNSNGDAVDALYKDFVSRTSVDGEVVLHMIFFIVKIYKKSTQKLTVTR